MRYPSAESIACVACVFSLVISSCTTLVKDDVTLNVEAKGHCSGSEWTDDSSIAVLPVPVVAFFVPHTGLNEIKAEQYLRRCGSADQVINREVAVNKVACVPAALTRIITLGIWQWCPAKVSWDADVK